VATPLSVVCAGGIVAARVASSAPVTVTVAPLITALLGSTTVTFSVPVGGCANAGTAEQCREQNEAQAKTRHGSSIGCRGDYLNVRRAEAATGSSPGVNGRGPKAGRARGGARGMLGG
jgi:hypothetical protein